MATSTKFKSRNLWKILFGISLGLNLLIVGAIGGAMIRMSKGPAANHRGSGLLYMRALNFEDKKLLRKEIFKTLKLFNLQNKRVIFSYLFFWKFLSFNY